MDILLKNQGAEQRRGMSGGPVTRSRCPAQNPPPLALIINPKPYCDGITVTPEEPGIGGTQPRRCQEGPHRLHCSQVPQAVLPHQELPGGGPDDHLLPGGGLQRQPGTSGDLPMVCENVVASNLGGLVPSLPVYVCSRYVGCQELPFLPKCRMVSKSILLPVKVLVWFDPSLSSPADCFPCVLMVQLYETGASYEGDHTMSRLPYADSVFIPALKLYKSLTSKETPTALGRLTPLVDSICSRLSFLSCLLLSVRSWST